ncbi:FecCD family ABC transporter permease [Corynebacterium macclintockiae]|uniref:FecCD family ABC transporter permease n=1 Tax=Corynebacterium macclintockiae TaxID=2913501 RepID=UPI00254E7FF7|nr:iron ABC transporter permease [Corynebacterium macclintockiae]MDK8870464.1 iron ABC transporter permease [Corynebacterium macclintockiae]
MSNTTSIGSIKRSRKRRILAATSGFALIAAFCYCLILGQGAVKLSPVEVIEVLTGGGTQQAINVVWDLRLPVAIATVLVGAALGLAGAWTQTMARNPLASPDILGVSGGAAVLVVAGTVVARPAWSEELPTFWWRAALALVGALVIVGLLVLLGGFGTSQRVVVIGLALSFLTQSLVQYLLLRADLTRATDAQTWLAGSTGFVRTEALLPMALGLLPFVVLGLCVTRDVPLLSHDDATASTLGVNVTRVRAILLIAATGIVAVVVSFVGPIGFVALLAPQLAKLVAGTPTPHPLCSTFAGAALLAACAVVAGALPFTSPVGLVTAIIGGPALVLLVWLAARRGTLKGMVQ